MQWRINAEEVAFQDGCATEEAGVDKWLRSAVHNTNCTIRRRLGLNFVQFGFGYYSTALIYGTAAIAIAMGMDGVEAGDPRRAQWIAQFLGILLNLIYGVCALSPAARALGDRLATTVHQLRNGHKEPLLLSCPRAAACSY